ncbi:helix-turn-helix domain-containing protein [Rhodococcus sp. T2V]|uniref:helix-turn-helix domain-containing protein n=1 Tax=Rhodococcus sp. T2V TaxID=3034164 RepID=UPI0023E2DCC3|nr:helix-turn-helix domain-containing protein [Rhodococcus sp. T2V]MDF3313460.1 helix-turn-helix domain-containing protein [Rhodococcus sp. T2V]
MTSTSPGRGPKKLYDEIAAKVVELAGQGMSRAAIARQLDCAPSTVGRAARLAGVSFNREPTTKATEAAKIDARERRDLTVDALYRLSTKTMRKLNDALDADEATQSKNYATTIGILLDKAYRLEPPVIPVDESMDQAKDALQALHEAILDSVVYLDQDGNVLDEPPEPRHHPDGSYY